MLNQDFKDMLSALSEEGVEYLVVGAFALAAHGLPRATGDIDLLVCPSLENSRKVYRALQRFGSPVAGITPETFSELGIIFQIGVPPRRIDLITEIDGVSFAHAWSNRVPVTLDNQKVYILSCQDMVTNKRAAGRPKDKVDLEWLENSLDLSR
jgi:hypothetical protein